MAMFPLRRGWVLPTVAPLALAACGGDTPFTPQATTLRLSATSLTFSAIGATQPLSTEVLDQRGDPMAGVSIAWSSNNQGVATVTPSPATSVTVTAVGNGTTQIVATSGSLNGQATVTIAQVVAQLVKASGDLQTDTVGQELPNPLVVQANDANGNPIGSVTVTFQVTQGGGSVTVPSAVTGLNGRAQVRWTIGTTAGAPQAVRATAGTGSATPVTFDATAVDPGASPTVVVHAGDFQTGLAGFAVNVNPAVLVRDAANQPMANVSVTFVPSSGGAVTGTPAVTDANGIASVGSWTVQLGANTLTATVAGSGVVGSPLIFRATGAAQAYTIDVRYLTSITAAQRAAFDNAKVRWERLIYGDVPDGFASFPAETCGPGTPVINETIDDVIIYAQLDSIDGPGKIVGRAGPCLVRRAGLLPAVGVMTFDTADAAVLLSAGLFNDLILHEMAHVLGFGTIWPPSPGGLSLLVDSGGPDPHFIGAQGLAAFDRSGGANYAAGAKVPVENCVGFPPGTCGSASRDFHWRESVFEAELMTGFFSGPEPLSVISTASMGDLGYTVNYAGSDPYSVANPLAARARVGRGPVLELKDDILRVPILVVDASGNVVRVIPPR